MKNNDVLKTHKLFLLTDYDLEENYLRDMSKNGWELTAPARYTQKFRRAEPKDVIYKIDFLSDTSDIASYKKLYEDYGWEYLGIVNNFTYFRKDADGVNDEDMDIFSDNQSRFDMINRIFRSKFAPILVIFFCCVVTNFLNAIRSYPDDSGLPWLLITGAILLLYIAVFTRVTIGYFRIKNKLIGKAVK